MCILFKHFTGNGTQSPGLAKLCCCDASVLLQKQKRKQDFAKNLLSGSQDSK